jgi:uncharacterized protein (TIGR02453 family)
MGSFTGFAPQAFEFYERLTINNSRTWWNEHRGDYETFVRAPLQALLDEIQQEGVSRIYRPYRDVRFSKDKAPIKDHQGAIVQVEDAIGYYVQVSAAGLMVAAGWYAPLGRQVEAYRRAVDGPAGAALEPIVARLAKKYTIDGDPVATRPRGTDPNHPRLALLRNRRLIAIATYDIEPWVHTRAARTRIAKDWQAMSPMVDWLIDHVGPASDPDTDT